MATLEELEQMNMEDLQELANQNMETAVDDKPAPKRNAHGQFATEEEGTGEEQQEEAAGEGEGEQQEEQPATQQPTIYRRVIDLGDGSGTQVFEGATQEELIDKLTKAQENATRKIRELSTTNRQTEQEHADNEYIISQELLARPTDAIKRIFEKVVGMPIENFKTTVEKVKAFEAKSAARDAAAQFVTSTPAYYDVESNGARLGRYLNRFGLEFTVENMKKAFEELSADGLLVQRPQEPSAGNGNASAEQPRIATPAQPATPQRRTGSNLSSRGRSVAPPAKKKLTETDLYSMDIDKLQDLANRQLKGELAEE